MGDKVSRTGPKKRGWIPYALAAPGTIWMLLFIFIPFIGILLFSFWKSTFSGMVPEYTLSNWAEFFTNPIYARALWRTLRNSLIVVGLCILFGYPVAYYLTMMVRSKVNSITLLILCIIPFWTSLTIRALAWIPMLGVYGVINTALQGMGITNAPIESLLFSEPAIIFVMTQLYIVFIVGPITFSLSRIDPYWIDAAKDLGAGPVMVFRKIILPLSVPGLAAGVMFVFVMCMGDFATYGVIGGFKYTSLPLLIMTKVGSIRWPMAATTGLVLSFLTFGGIFAIMRGVDLKNI